MIKRVLCLEAEIPIGVVVHYVEVADTSGRPDAETVPMLQVVGRCFSSEVGGWFSA